MLTTVDDITMPDFVGEKRRFRIKKAVQAVFEGLSVLNAATYTLLIIHTIETLTGTVSQLAISCFLLVIPFIFVQLTVLAAERLILMILNQNIRSSLYK